jgi:hypothetical protein
MSKLLVLLALLVAFAFVGCAFANDATPASADAPATPASPAKADDDDDLEEDDDEDGPMFDITPVGEGAGDAPPINVQMPTGTSRGGNPHDWSHPNVTLTAYLTKGTGGDQKSLLQGELAELVIGFRNTGDKTFNVTHIFCAIVYVHDFNNFIQNFTRDRPDLIIEPNTEVSFVYPFRPDPMIEPRDWGFIGVVAYTDDVGSVYQSVFWNSTLTVIESEGEFSAQIFFTYVLSIGALGLFLYILYRSFTKKSRSSSYTRRETGTVGSSAETDEWLQGTAADPAIAAKSAWGKSKNKSA